MSIRYARGSGTASPWPHFTDAHVVPLSLHGAPSQALAHGAGQLRGVRGVAPKSGTLGGLWVCNTGLGTTTQHNGAIYKVDKSTLARTKAWESGWLSTASAPAVANNWYSLGDPNLPVTAGDWLDLALGVAGASGPTFLRSTSWIIGPRLPNNGDFPSWLVTTGIANGTPLPSSLALAALTTGTPAPFIVASYK